MNQLSQQTCQACSIDAPTLDAQQCRELQSQIPEWQIIDHDGIMKLQRCFEFRNFRQALAFTNRVGELAEDAGHHPALLTEWGRVTVTWWSHKINGLHHNDFILAARTDEVAT